MRLAATVLASALVTGLSVICCIDPAAAQRGKVGARSEFAKQNDTCFQCHSALNPGLAQEWLASAHGQQASAATTATGRKNRQRCFRA